jgi:hypothetical protein
MNILEQSEALKDIPEAALMREMQMPTGSFPQYLVLTEIKRRKRMRDEFQRREAQDMPTVAEEAVMGAGMPQQGIMQMAKSMAPQTSMGQNTGIANAAPRQPTMGMAKGGIVNMRAGGKLVNFKGREFAVFEDGEVYRIFKDDKGKETGRLKEPSPAVRRMIIEETKMLDDRKDQTVVDVEESGLEAFEASEANTAGSDIRKEIAELAQTGAGAAEIANRLGTDVATVLSVSSGIIGDGILRSGALFVDTMAAATAFMGAKGPAEILAGNAKTIRDFSDFLFTKGERGEGFFGETLPKNPVIDPDGILSDYFKSAAPEGGYLFPTSVAERQKLSDEEEAARAAYEEQQQAETIAALGGSVIGAPYISPDEGEYDRLSNLLQGQAGPIPVAPGAISAADTVSNLPFATGEMYEAPIAAPDPTAAAPQNLSAIQQTTSPASVLQAPSAAPTSGLDAEFSDYMQAERDKSREVLDRKLEKMKIRDVLGGRGSGYVGTADLIDKLRENNKRLSDDGRDTAGNQLLGHLNLRGRDPFFSGDYPEFTTLQDVAEYGGAQTFRDVFGGKPKSDAERDLENRSLDYFAGDQFTPPSEIYSDLLGGDPRAIAKYQEEPLSVIDQISDRLYREAQQGELAKQEQLFGDYDAEAQAQRDAEIAGQRDVLEQAALARAGERLKDQQPTEDLTGVAGAIQKGLDYVDDPALNYLEGAIGKFGELVESGQQKVGDYFDARRAMESDEANLGAGNQIIDPSQTAKARQDAADKKVRDIIAAEQASATKASKAASAQAGSLEARIADAIAKREKRAEQDKWLALAQTGVILASGNPADLATAGTAGIKALTTARAQQDKFDVDMLGLQQRIDAYKARIAAAGKGGLTANQMLTRGTSLLKEGQTMLENAGDNADLVMEAQQLIDYGRSLIGIAMGGSGTSSGGNKTVKIS